MGTNTLFSKNDGEIIEASDPNQYRTALSGDLVPRNGGGVPTHNSASVGTSSLKWSDVKTLKVSTPEITSGTDDLVISCGTQDMSATANTVTLNTNSLNVESGTDSASISAPSGGTLDFGDNLYYSAASPTGHIGIFSRGSGFADFGCETSGRVRLLLGSRVVFNSQTSVSRILSGSGDAALDIYNGGLGFAADGFLKDIYIEKNLVDIGATNTECKNLKGTGTLTFQDVYSSVTGGSGNVVVDSSGRMKRATSSKKYKTNIKDLDKNEILKLRPVTFDGIGDDPARDQIGLIAEEVNEIEPRLAIKDPDGNIEGVNYQAIGPMLIPIIKELKEKVDRLESQVEALSARTV